MPRNPLRTALLAPIRFYRRFISPLMAPRCKYYPTCSHYAEQAVREYGLARGSVLAVWRVLRCNPLSDGGFDYVENQRIFASHKSCGHDHADDSAKAAH